MFFSLPTAGPGGGIWVPEVDATEVINRSGGAVAVGDVLQFDMQATDGDVTTFDFGDPNSIWKNVIAPRAGAITGNEVAVFCVALGAAADNATISRVRIYDKVDQAFIIGATGSMAVGTDLVVTTAKNFDIVVATTEVIVGIGGGAVATPTTRTLGGPVFINGFRGLFASAA